VFFSHSPLSLFFFGGLLLCTQSSLSSIAGPISPSMSFVSCFPRFYRCFTCRPTSDAGPKPPFGVPLARYPLPLWCWIAYSFPVAARSNSQILCLRCCPTFTERPRPSTFGAIPRLLGALARVVSTSTAPSAALEEPPPSPPLPPPTNFSSAFTLSPK